MQWLIDEAVDAVLARMSGIIMAWHGLIADIPDGWVLCDGNNGTPNLAGSFLLGTTSQPGMNQFGGTFEHTHEFTADSHYHTILDTGLLQAGVAYDKNTNAKSVTGETESVFHLPPYYSLAFIMKT